VIQSTMVLSSTSISVLHDQSAGRSVDYSSSLTLFYGELER
jgi:hypothetical protein